MSQTSRSSSSVMPLPLSMISTRAALPPDVAAYGDRPVLSGVVHGVAHEVVYYAVYAVAVGADEQVALYIGDEGVALGLLHYAEVRGGREQLLGNIHDPDVQFEHARLQFGQLYDLADERGETVGFVYYDLCLLGALFLVAAGNVAYHLGVRADHGQRRFHIVRNVGEQVAAETVVAFYIVERLIERGGQLVYLGKLGVRIQRLRACRPQ